MRVGLFSVNYIRKNKKGSSGRIKIPSDWPRQICFKFCLGICSRPTTGNRKCHWKHEKTPEAMKIINELSLV